MVRTNFQAGTGSVTDYSGPVTIKATCAAGGLFTSTTSFSKTVAEVFKNKKDIQCHGCWM